MLIDKVLSKKVFLIISSIYIILLVAYFSFEQQCHLSWFCKNQLLNIQIFQAVGIPLIGVFIVSLLTFRMDERIFKAWSFFAFFAAPVISYLMYQDLIAPQSGGFIGGNFMGIGALIFNGLFVIISVIIITVNSLNLKKKTVSKTRM